MSCKWSKMIWKFKVCCKNLWIMTIYQVSGPQTCRIYHKIYVRLLFTKSLLPAHAEFTTKFVDDDYLSSLCYPHMLYLPQNLWMMTIYQVSAPHTCCIYHKIYGWWLFIKSLLPAHAVCIYHKFYGWWLITKSLLPAHAVFTSKFMLDDYLSSLCSWHIEYLPPNVCLLSPKSYLATGHVRNRSVSLDRLQLIQTPVQLLQCLHWHPQESFI